MRHAVSSNQGKCGTQWVAIRGNAARMSSNQEQWAWVRKGLRAIKTVLSCVDVWYLCCSYAELM